MRETTVMPPLDNDLLMEGRPKAAEYARRYGKISLMSEMYPSADFYKKGYNNSEEVYADCLRTGKTWQELLNYKKKELEDVIL